MPDAVGEAAGKAVAAVKGQVGTARAAVTEQAETHMRNAQEELREEHVEIAIYTRLETSVALTLEAVEFAQPRRLGWREEDGDGVFKRRLRARAGHGRHAAHSG